MEGNRSEKVEGMGEGKGELSVAFFRLVNLLDEVSVCPGMHCSTDTTCTH